MCFERIANIFKPNQKLDPVFGLIKHCKPLFHFGLWRGKTEFSPLNVRVDVYVIAKRSGILESQRRFYGELEQHYNELDDAIRKTMFGTLDVYHGDLFHDFEPQELWQDFELERVFIPYPKEPPDYWELSYVYKPHNQSYTIYFDGWKPIYGEYDD